MRIAFLCKRKYMGKDVIDDRYARLYEIPFQLANLGHDVHGWCLGYQGQPPGQWQHVTGAGRLRWSAARLGRWKLPEAIAYPRHLLLELQEFKPDVLIGASDIPHVALAAWLGGKLRLPYAIDLYDNFEGFGQARIPGMKWLLRRAARNAGLVTATSEPLARMVRDTYGATGKVVAMPSTIDKAVFYRRDRLEARSKLALPTEARLIGTAGGLLRDRGVGTLYDAWAKLSEEYEDLHLVLAGPVDPRFGVPAGPRVHYLGMLPHSTTAELFSALDVGIIYLRDTPFGRYCFPQKAYEMVACGLPVVAASVGAVSDLFADFPDFLYAPDEPDSLASQLRRQLARPTGMDIPVPGWSDVIGEMESWIYRMVKEPDRGASSRGQMPSA